MGGSARALAWRGSGPVDGLLVLSGDWGERGG